MMDSLKFLNPENHLETILISSCNKYYHHYWTLHNCNKKPFRFFTMMRIVGWWCTDTLFRWSTFDIQHCKYVN